MQGVQQPKREPNVREMLFYLENNKYRSSRALKETEIKEMFLIVYGTIETIKLRLPAGNRDCFGDYKEERSADCWLAGSGLACGMMSGCKRLTELQEVHDKRVADQAEKELKKSAKKTTKKTSKPKAKKKTEPEPTPEEEAPPPELPKSTIPVKDDYGFSASSKMGRVTQAIISGNDGKKTFTAVAEAAAEVLKLPVKQMRRIWQKAKYVLKTRGYTIAIDKNDKLTIKKPS